MCLGIPGQIVEITDIVKKLAMVSISGVKREEALPSVPAVSSLPS